MRQTSLVLLLLVLSVALFPGCDRDDPVLAFVVVTPEGEDTFAGVTEVRALFGSKEKRTTLSSSASPFDLKVELPPGESGTVLLEGLGSQGQVLCRGKSPQLLAVGASQTLTLYVARLGAFGRSPSLATGAASAMAAVDYRVENWDGIDNDTSATVFFGGITDEGTTASTVFYYDTYFHQTFDLPDLPAPRSGLTAMNIDSGYFLLFGGRSADGGITGQLDMLRPGGTQFEYATDLDYGLTDAARTEAAVGMLGPYASLIRGSSFRIFNSFLVVGGEGPTGPRCDALHLVAGYDLSTYLWSVEGDRRDLAACRRGHTVTITRRGTGASAEIVALIYGGAESSSDPLAETITLSPTQVDANTVDWGLASDVLLEAPGPMVTGHAALTLDGGKILILGGQTTDGTALSDAWLYDPTGDSFTALPALLETPRYGHTVTRVGHELVVAGGRGADGTPLATAEVFDLSTGSPVRLLGVPLARARAHHHAFVMPTGTIGILGGVDAEGKAVTEMEIYTPGLVD